MAWETEEEEGGVALSWAGWAEAVVLGGPEAMLEELDVWEGEEEEAKVGLRWDRREASRDCSDRYGAENDHQ